MEHLYTELMKYSQGEDYPYHMPGHKRRLYGALPPSLFQMDITEIDGFDNLHEPEGLIAALQDRIAQMYGARKSYCLVGSSTAGILSAVSFAVPMGGHILMARNCHKSAYHAAYLRRLKISYLYPKVLEGYGITDGISARQVAEALSQEKDIDAVLVVSPTYEGRISPIREIARVTHQYGKMLIVDEAHGAHLVLAEDAAGDTDDRIPDQAGLDGQAYCDMAGVAEEDKPDLVIQSIHKTLPALTQTAVLHVYGRRVDLTLLERYLHIYQSSSPSYVLMAGVDNCFTILERRGRELYREFKRRFQEMVEELKHCRFIRILATGCAEGEAYSPARQDVGKLLLYPHPQLLTGQQLYDLLREEYHLQLEMAAREFCLAMFTIGDTQEGFDRMRNAVQEIDGRLAMKASGKVRLHKAETQDKEQNKGSSVMTETDIEPNEGKESIEVKGPNESNFEKFEVGEFLTGVDDFGRDQTAETEIGIPLGEAWDLPNEEVALTAAEGRLSADFINLYPPGTPILAPGERFTKRICDYLLKCHAQGLRIQGLGVESSVVKCKVIK